jgi:DJ-1/PfpI family
MKIAIGLYERFTSLDALGPFQVLSMLPGAEVVFVAAKAGPVTDESGFLEVRAQASFADVPKPDILLVPGGTITGSARGRCSSPVRASSRASTRRRTGRRSTTSRASARIRCTSASSGAGRSSPRRA